MAITAPPTSGPSLRAPRILIVDDDPLVVRSLRRQLVGARPGWQIDGAESGEAALRLLDATSYDVVVTDLHMPPLDGVTLLARLKSERPTVMRVIHSSHVGSLAPGLSEQLAHAVLKKPVRADELVRALDWALEQRRRKLRDSVGY